MTMTPTPTWLTSAQTPPPVKGMMGCVYWERTPDPFHPAAFKGTELDPLHSPSIERRLGWMAIDWCENPVGWVPDGTAFTTEAPVYTFTQGPFSHLCAYPPGEEELIKRHAQDRARLKEKRA